MGKGAGGAEGLRQERGVQALGGSNPLDTQGAGRNDAGAAEALRGKQSLKSDPALLAAKNRLAEITAKNKAKLSPIQPSASIPHQSGERDDTYVQGAGDHYHAINTVTSTAPL